MVISIISWKNTWRVKKRGAQRAMKVFKTLKDAEVYATGLKDVEEIFIHRKDGSVARRITILIEEGRKTTVIDFFSKESTNGI
jgi:hypothetical protein